MGQRLVSFSWNFASFLKSSWPLPPDNFNYPFVLREYLSYFMEGWHLWLWLSGFMLVEPNQKYFAFLWTFFLKYRITLSWPETGILRPMKIGTFIVTANTPLERGSNPSWSCFPKADKGDRDKATVSNKRQVREHSRNPVLSSFGGSMRPPEGLHRGEMAFPLARPKAALSEKSENGGLDFIANLELLWTQEKFTYWHCWILNTVSFQGKNQPAFKKQNNTRQKLTVLHRIRYLTSPPKPHAPLGFSSSISGNF